MIEDKRALLFMGIVVTFVACNFPRVLLDLHEVFTLGHANECMMAGYFNSLPYWVFVVGNFSHVLLVLNATANMYIYGFNSPIFRSELKALIESCTFRQTENASL